MRRLLRKRLIFLRQRSLFWLGRTAFKACQKLKKIITPKTAVIPTIASKTAHSNYLENIINSLIRANRRIINL
ncbi:hypothetical protein A3F02_00900 [Candidatus Curtissbacteria bacterium RIFCSPHIGHO2_12_FULL_38_9b]|uniref:Uncharacterized protein n=1 Tax=Candidatus Curtissbacteria bacterium RIFCSPHIGHO2_12_FULL_38_9b TaxID=1797720 RepID=A0A1F5GVQ6_9BACT|nr:MAG: hypothetical protein A3F02_00900 [Candidatus Curtissbacteria bacterium RIFCSPHIGHO2_12_FULL_38_9b]